MEERIEKVEKAEKGASVWPMVAAGAAVFAVLVIGVFVVPRMLGMDFFASLAPAPAPVPAHPATSGEDRKEEDTGGQEAQGGEPAAPAHVHDWQPVYGLERVGVVIEEVEVAPVMGTETTPETVCNVCQDVITGRVREHGQETGHAGSTPGVPVAREVVVEPAKKTEVVKDPGTDKLVIVGEKCSTCSMTRTVEDEEGGAQ